MASVLGRFSFATAAEKQLRLLTMASVNSATPMKKADLGLLEEDDEFEEFPAEGNTYPFIGHLS